MNNPLLQADDLITGSEIALRLKMSVGVISFWRNRYPNFPQPIAYAIKGKRPLYLWPEVLNWRKETLENSHEVARLGIRRSGIKEGDGDQRHGTVNGYSNLNCRCVFCKKANTDAHRDYMRRNAIQLEKQRERQKEDRLKKKENRVRVSSNRGKSGRR